MDGIKNRRTVVIIQTDKAGDVGILHKCVLGIFLRAHGVSVVRADVNDLNVRTLERVLDAARSGLSRFPRP